MALAAGSRTVVEDAEVREVLDALDSRVSRLLDRNSTRNMPGNRQAEFWRFLRDGKERLARRPVVHLDEIHTAPLQVSDRLTRLLGIGNVTSVRPVRGAVVEDRSSCDDLGSEQLTAVDSIPQRQDEIDIGTHVARPDDAVRQKQLQRFGARSLVMRVHIPKPGNEKHPRAVHSRGSGWDRDPPADGRDLASLRHDGHGGLACATDDIDQRDVGDGDRILRQGGHRALLDGDLARRIPASVPACRDDEDEARDNVPRRSHDDRESRTENLLFFAIFAGFVFFVWAP